MKFATALASGVIALSLLTGCGGGGGGTTPAPTAQELTAQGWEFFVAAQYDSAETHFLAATAVDGTFADGWNGLGWARLFNADTDLANAASAFETANDRNFAGADAWAGLAAVQRERDLPAAITAADSALERSPAFVFAHNSAIDSRDLHLVRGQAALLLYRLADAQVEADTLSAGNGLDPGSPASWVVGGVTCPSYFDALSKLFQDAAAVIGGDLP